MGGKVVVKSRKKESKLFIPKFFNIKRKKTRIANFCCDGLRKGSGNFISKRFWPKGLHQKDLLF